MDDMGGGDCTTDGTCEEADSGGEKGFDIGVKASNASLLEETTLAIQQFSVVIGVALMVFVLFFVMIAIDKTMEFIGNRVIKCCGRKNRNYEVDPAELVGSFKRYKN